MRIPGLMQCAAVVALFGAGCATTPGEGQRQETASVAADEDPDSVQEVNTPQPPAEGGPADGDGSERITFVPSALPVDSMECWLEIDAAYALCEWAESVDELVIGQVVSLGFATTPAYVGRSGERTVMDECPSGGQLGGCGLALEVNLELLHSLRGELPAGELVTVRVGPEVGCSRIPHVERREGGEPKFVYGTKTDFEPLYGIGTVVGIGASWVADGAYLSTGDEHFFTFASDGTLSWEPHVCRERQTEAGSYDELLKVLSSCPRDSAELAAAGERIRSEREARNPSPTHWYAAICSIEAAEDDEEE